VLQRRSKEKLLDAIQNFKEVELRDGVASVDFGVKGGELDKKSRAPRNLAADGAFFRISEDLGRSANRILGLVRDLERAEKCRGALRYFGTADGALCPLNGTWRLLFTTAADATFSRNSTRGGAAVSNIVDAVAGTITNCIDFEPREDGKSPTLEQLRVRLTAQAESDVRLVLAFRYVKAQLTRLFGIPLGRRRVTVKLPVPAPLITRIRSIFNRKPPPKPYFDLLYLDNTLRVHRTGEGNIFVQGKVVD